jgi:hypothetical protein
MISRGAGFSVQEKRKKRRCSLSFVVIRSFAIALQNYKIATVNFIEMSPTRRGRE